MWSRRRWTLAGQFLALQLAVLLMVLVVASVVSVRQSDADFRDTRGARLRAAAENLANTPAIRDGISDPTVPQSLASYTQRVRNDLRASGVYLTDPQGIVRVSSDFAGLGEQIDLTGSTVQRLRAWSGDINDFGEPAIAAEVPVIDDSGSLVGIAVVTQSYPTWAERARGVFPDLVTFLGFGLALGLAGSWLLARLIKRRTRGLEPADIAALADQREALLHSIREGVVAVSPEGVVTVLNDSARDLLHLPEGGEGLRVADLGVEPGIAYLLTGTESLRDEIHVVDSRVVVVNRNPVREGTRLVGTVTTLRDRTELLALQSELSARESITGTLRAQTHEFHNQLHTISGLVQLEEYDEVARFVGTLSRRRAEISDAVTSHVDDPAVAALLIAKSSMAAERGVVLSLTEETALPRLDPELSTDVGTVLGNLVDNAIDATVGAQDALVEVRLVEEGEAVVIWVTDTGQGIAPELVGEVFKRGWSTKPAGTGGRGVGLALVQVVCGRRGGEVSVSNAAQGGAVFVARLPHRPTMGEGESRG